jgi:hypothetical protein
MGYGQYSANHAEKSNPLASQPMKTKRQRQVFPTDEIPHLWMHKTQDAARNPQGNLFFHDETIFSYREGAPLARHVTNKRKQSAVLVNTARWSVTTSAQQSSVRQAIPENVLRFEVPSLGSCYLGSDGVDHTENLKYFVESATERIAKASRARSTYAITSNLGYATGLVESARAYGKFFGVKVPKLPTVPEADSEKLAAIGKREREESARKSKEQREENERRKAAMEAARAKYEQELPGLLDQWRAGADVSIPSPDWGWYEYGKAPVVPTMLRVMGDEVQTSRGARVPIDHAARALKFVQACVSSQREYVRNGHTEHIGNYPIDRIEANGTLHAGCHVIEYAEIQRIAPALSQDSAEVQTSQSA